MRRLILIITVTLMMGVVLTSAVITAPVYGQGVFLRGSGAINESMGGAATAAPIDGLGALMWNPATLSALPSSEIAFSNGLVLPNSEISTPYGSVRGEPGVVPAPSMGLVIKNPCSRWTYGIGVQGVGGAKTSFPNLSQLGNDPLLSRLSTLNSDILILQLVPTASCQVTEKLSFGFAPTLTICQVMCDPLYITEAPEDVIAGYLPSGTSTRYNWGGGFQVGLYYDTKANWQYGFSYKSQQYMEPFRYSTRELTNFDPSTGVYTYRDGTRKLHLNLPDVMSLGVAYTGFEKTILAADLRYFSYQAAGDFNKLGWSNIFSLNLGVQRIINDKLTVRMGYVVNDSQIDSAYAYANLASAMITQHTIMFGASVKLTCQIQADFCYAHAFESSLEGNVPITGTPITQTLSANTLNMGVRVVF